jgi:hypothetical protein
MCMVAWCIGVCEALISLSEGSVFSLQSECLQAFMDLKQKFASTEGRTEMLTVSALGHGPSSCDY